MADPQETAEQKWVREKKTLHTQCVQNINSLASEFAAALEWGIFEKGSNADPTKDPRKIILESLEAAQKALEKADKEADSETLFLAVDQSLLIGKQALCERQDAEQWYRLNTRYGFSSIGFTAASTAAAYYFILYLFLGYKVSDSLHSAIFLGLAGAVLRSLYFSQYQINRGVLRPRWHACFIVAPFIGMLLGGLASLIVKTSVKIGSSSADTTADWRLVGLVAAFAGFNWLWALEKFKAGAEAVMTRSGDKQK